MKVVIHILNICSQKQIIALTKTNLNFGNTAIFVRNETRCFELFSKKNEKTKKEKRIFLLDRNPQRNQLINSLKRAKNNFFAINHRPFTL